MHSMSGIVNVCPPQLHVSGSNLSLVLPESGNASFPGETKLLLYHSAPQVFSCSQTVACKRRGKGAFTDANPTHTQMLFVMPVRSQKAAGCPITDSVPNWHSTAVCTDQCTGRTMRPCLPFFYDIESRPHFAIAAVGLEQMVPTKIRALMCFMCPDDHQGTECNRRVWESTHDSEQHVVSPNLDDGFFSKHCLTVSLVRRLV